MSDNRGSVATTSESPILEAQRPVPTGNLIVTLHKDVSVGDQAATIRRLTDKAPLIGELHDLTLGNEIPAGDTILFKDFGVAVVAPKKGGNAMSVMASLHAADEVLEARPEFFLFALQLPFADTADRTWGIAATQVDQSPYTGSGIKVAVLDTGLDLSHPDFQHLTLVTQNFVTPGSSVQDGHGHGTHCAGTICGRPALGGVPRYGVAQDVALYVGKVMSDQGSGSEQGILAGLAWAISEGCDIVSMSLGSTVRPGEGPNVLYDRLGQNALARGSLIIAAAGNDSARVAGFIAPVSQPANSPSIMAVAALDQAQAIAYFSNGGINLNGGEIDIAGPGVNVFSTTTLPRRYRTLGGTSMACPHVAGIAALWAQSDASLRGKALWDALTANARTLPLPARDVGAGLVQAPIGPAGAAVAGLAGGTGPAAG